MISICWNSCGTQPGYWRSRHCKCRREGATTPICKGRRQYLLTCKVSRYRLLPLHVRALIGRISTGSIYCPYTCAGRHSQSPVRYRLQPGGIARAACLHDSRPACGSGFLLLTTQEPAEPAERATTASWRKILLAARAGEVVCASNTICAEQEKKKEKKAVPPAARQIGLQSIHPPSRQAVTKYLMLAAGGNSPIPTASAVQSLANLQRQSTTSYQIKKKTTREQGRRSWSTRQQ